MQAANCAAKPQRGCHRRRRRGRRRERERERKGNYRLVIELCHLSRLPLAEMDQNETDSDDDSEYLWLSNKNSVQLRRCCIVLNTFMTSAPRGQGGAEKLAEFAFKQH